MTASATANGATHRWQAKAFPPDVHQAAATKRGGCRPEDLIVLAGGEVEARTLLAQRFGIEPTAEQLTHPRWQLERLPDPTAQRAAPLLESDAGQGAAAAPPPRWQFLNLHLARATGYLGTAGSLLTLELIAEEAPDSFWGDARPESHLEAFEALRGRLPPRDSRSKLQAAQLQLSELRRQLAAVKAAEASAVERADHLLAAGHGDMGRSALVAQQLDETARHRKVAAELRGRLALLEGLAARAQEAVAAEERQRAEVLPQLRAEVQRLRAEFEPRLRAARGRLAAAVGSELAIEYFTALAVLQALPRDLPG